MRTLIGIGTGIALLAMVSLGSEDLVWAGGGGGGPSCAVTNGRGQTIEGTVAVGVPDVASGTPAEAILRLEYRGVEKFFRAATGGGTILSAAHLVCDILAVPPRTDLGEDIYTAFGIPPSHQLVLRCQEVPGSDPDCSRAIRDASDLGPIPGSPVSNAIGDVRITVLRP